jgi:protein TonB
LILAALSIDTPAAAQQPYPVLQSNYRVRVSTHLMHHRPRFKRGEAPGIARVFFSIDARGRVTRVSLVQSSGSAHVDQEALAMVRRASPFPPPPNGRPINFTLPVRFAY